MVSSRSAIPVRILLSYVIIRHSIVLKCMVAPSAQVPLKFKLKLLENIKTIEEHMDTILTGNSRCGASSDLVIRHESSTGT
jgi:hypothetical protein